MEPLHEARLGLAVERARDSHGLVGRIDPAAGEDEFARHEFMARVALAEQDFRYAARTVDEDQGCRVLRPDRRMRQVALDLVHAPYEFVQATDAVDVSFGHRRFG